MSSATANLVADRRKLWRDQLFHRWVDAKRQAQDSDDPADHRIVAEAYLAFMRAHLGEDERSRIELENEVARLAAEIMALRRRAEEDAHTAAA